MSPEASKTKPDPTPVDGTENGPYPASPAESTVIVTTLGLADSATATTASADETPAGVVALVFVALAGPVPVAPRPVSSPTVPNEPTTADSMDTARTPASHRPRNGREEVAVPTGVAMGSPTSVAADDPPGEDGRIGWSGSTTKAEVLPGARSEGRSKLSMTISTARKPETVLRIPAGTSRLRSCTGCPYQRTDLASRAFVP